MAFSYTYEEDSIEYNAEEALKILEGNLDSDISNICKQIANIVSTLGDLQKIAHDKENTNIAQDYIDFETIIGDDAEGLNGFVADANDLLLSIHKTLCEWQRITSK